MKITRKAAANWKGTGKEGNGTLSTESGILNGTQYHFKSRFEDGKGTNPEELLGASHAGCYTMQLSFLLNEAGYTADELNTSAAVTLEDKEISTIALSIEGAVPEISESEFREIAEKAKEVCPVSKVLNANLTLEVNLK
jgi:osmotically inducible protein OsmC